MKNKIGCRIIAMFAFFYVNIVLCITPCLSGESFHIRKGVWGDPPQEYKFRNVPEDGGFVKEFPLETVQNKIKENCTGNITLEYWVYTSVDDAEMAMVERLDMSNLSMQNIIDFPLPGGQIGDNCWHQLGVGAIQFIRNNILVSITPSSFDSSADLSFIEGIAREIDSVIVNSEKVYDTKLILAPEIHEIQIISSLPKNWDDQVAVKINATDPKGGKLFFRKYATGFALVSEDGALNFSLNKNTDSVEDSNRAKVKIWVWNEDNIVTSIEHEIPF